MKHVAEIWIKLNCIQQIQKKIVLQHDGYFFHLEQRTFHELMIDSILLKIVSDHRRNMGHD